MHHSPYVGSPTWTNANGLDIWLVRTRIRWQALIRDFDFCCIAEPGHVGLSNTVVDSLPLALPSRTLGSLSSHTMTSEMYSERPDVSKYASP